MAADIESMKGSIMDACAFAMECLSGQSMAFISLVLSAVCCWLCTCRMSQAVEGAAIMLYGVSEKYKESANVSHKSLAAPVLERTTSRLISCRWLRTVRSSVGWSSTSKITARLRESCVLSCSQLADVLLQWCPKKSADDTTDDAKRLRGDVRAS